MNVISIEGDVTAVENFTGNKFYVSVKSILENMYSANHFAKEVNTNMSGLAEVL